MRIAQIAPLYERVPPEGYGGTERIVAYLTDELVRAGHDVTLFASGDSLTLAGLVRCCSRSLRLDPECQDSLAPHVVMLDRVLRRARRYDILHFHTGYLHFPLMRRLRTPHVTTMHGRHDLPELAPVFRRFRDVPLVSISDDQRHPAPGARWVGTVHHGLPEDLLPLSTTPQGYLAFLGRISPEKRPDRAIAIARAAGQPLRIAAKVDRIDRDYFEQQIAPLIHGDDVTLVGEIGEERKAEFLGGADALLFPIDWPEPFGVVMIEAMACGTPVIAWNCGSVPEIIEHGRSGFIVNSMEEAIEATRAVGTLSRAACRAAFEERFTSARMAQEYLRIYESLAARPHAALLEEEVS